MQLKGGIYAMIFIAIAIMGFSSCAQMTAEPEARLEGKFYSEMGGYFLMFDESYFIKRIVIHANSPVKNIDIYVQVAPKKWKRVKQFKSPVNAATPINIATRGDAIRVVQKTQIYGRDDYIQDIEAFGSLIATAQVQPPRRATQGMVRPDEAQNADESPFDIRKTLVGIAQRASDQSMSQMVDLAFVIDGSVPMAESAGMVERSLADMAATFAGSGIDYRFGLIWFQHGGKQQMWLKPLQEGLVPIENTFATIAAPRKFRGNIAGYGIDAIMEGVLKFKFRSEAENHLVVVTNSKLKTSWGVGQTRKSEVEKILEWCKIEDIHINVIGVDEDIQRQLADSTSGKFYRISKDRQKVNRAPQIDKSAKNRPTNKIDEIFSGIAQHITATVNQPADIVFFCDASLSMDDKVRDICTGLDSLVKILDSERLDYRFGVIRFWAGADGGKSAIRTTNPPLNIEQVKNLFRLRRHGDENLLDAIMEGVPEIKTPDDRKLVLVIVTDEPSTHGPRTEYTYAEAVEVCRNAGAQVNIIGGILSVGKYVDDFQRDVTEGTNGIHYVMPGAEEELLNSRYK